MNVLRFRRLFRAVLFSAGTCATAGCSDLEPTEMPERAQCVDLKNANRYAQLTLSPGVDGIAFATRSFGAGDGPEPTTTMLTSLGSPCARATSKADCLSRVDAMLKAPGSEGWMVNVNNVCINCGEVVTDLGVITSGDDVRLAALPDVLKAVAPVETREEAIALLHLQNRPVDCGTNNVRTDPDGWTFKYTSRSCSGEAWETFTKVSAETGEATIAGRRQLSDADNGCMEGRRPANLANTGVAWLSSLSACFGEIAHMEAAAVLAFDELERALVRFDAPADLLARVRRARADEVAHAAITERLAHRFGGTPSTPRVEPDAHEVTLLDVALENATEGCVREAMGALVAAHQAAHASDPEVREAFRRIAIDEAEHAELSFDLDAWLMTKLTHGERRLVNDAKIAAWSALADVCDEEPAPEVARVAGIPTARDARNILAHLAWTMSAAA
jgi:hypothetical protein